MQTIYTRAYTNVALTVLILLLLVLAVRPYTGLPLAQAQLSDTLQRNAQQINRTTDMNSSALNATATEKVAEATRDVAAAIRESAKAQQEIAKSLARLSEVTR